MTALGVAALLLHGLVMAAMAVLLSGALPRARARWAGRVGPPLLGPWHDWRRLLRKRPVVAEGTSQLLVWAPVTALAATALAALLVPSFTLGMATASLSDLVVLAGLMGLARAIMAMAAIDSGTAPLGLAAVRSLRLGALAEPALVLVVFAIALLTGTTNLDAAVTALHDAMVPGVPLLLAMAGLGILVLAVEAEGDAITGALSGWHAAAAQAAAALRRVVWLSLQAALLLPGGMALAGSGPMDWVVGLCAWIVKLGVLGAVCAVGGPWLHHARQSAIGPLMGAAVLLGLLAALFLFAGQGLT